MNLAPIPGFGARPELHRRDIGAGDKSGSVSRENGPTGRRPVEFAGVRCGRQCVGYVADLPTSGGEILLVGDLNDLEYAEL